MIDLNLDPSRRELRQFSVALLLASAVVGGILWWRLDGPNVFSRVLWIAGPLLAALGLAVPRAIKPVFIGLSLLAYPIGLVVGTLALLLVYFAIITPIALVFRLLGRDPLARRFDPAAETYWIVRKVRRGAGRYFQQF